jgi:precorrin-2 C20-methyltransferase
MRKSMRGKLYGVGVGPGDEKLLTILAVETLRSADKIVVPDTGGEKTALKIVQNYIQDKEILYCEMPMTRDEKILQESRQRAADQICGELEKGNNLAFITLGDPTIYSTYMYLHRLILEKGYQAGIVNGIPSFCAAAARLNISLCDKDEILSIIPSSYENLDKSLEYEGNKVLMKSGKSIMEVKEKLRNKHLLEQSKMVECCFMENEKIYENLEEVTENSSYFSVIIVKEESK